MREECRLRRPEFSTELTHSSGPFPAPGVFLPAPAERREPSVSLRHHTPPPPSLGVVRRPSSPRGGRAVLESERPEDEDEDEEERCLSWRRTHTHTHTGAAE